MSKPPEPPRPRIDAQRALELLGDPAFIKDLEAVFVHENTITPGNAPAQRLTPREFFERYGVLPRRVGSHPVRVGASPDSIFRLQNPTAPTREAEAILGGHWGLLRVFPWTTDAEIRAAGKRLRQALQQTGAKEHEDQERIRVARAVWLRQCGYSYVEIAKAVWRRRSGLRRPTLKQAMEATTFEQEQEILRRHQRRGLSPHQIRRHTHRSLRGSEAKAGAMVRKAIARERQRETRARDAIKTPASLEPVAGALTALLRQLNPREGSLAPLGRLPEIDALRRATLGLPRA